MHNEQCQSFPYAAFKEYELLDKNKILKDQSQLDELLYYPLIQPQSFQVLYHGVLSLISEALNSCISFNNLYLLITRSFICLPIE